MNDFEWVGTVLRWLAIYVYATPFIVAAAVAVVVLGWKPRRKP
jgi:hypothetical protein